MTDLSQLLSGISDTQRAALAQLLLQSLAPAESAPPAPALELVAQEPVASATATASTYYNMTEAVPVTFRAALAKSPKSRDTSFAERYDHVWCKGSYRVKGPKGGVYFVGRCVLGVKKGQQIKGTLRVGNKHFEAFLAGSPLDAWFRPEGGSEAILIGVLSNYKPIEQA